MQNLHSIEDFIMKYAAVRDQQKKYFQLKMYADLKLAKKMESELDELCRQYMRAKAAAAQTNLFNQNQ